MEVVPMMEPERFNQVVDLLGRPFRVHLTVSSMDFIDVIKPKLTTHKIGVIPINPTYNWASCKISADGCSLDTIKAIWAAQTATHNSFFQLEDDKFTGYNPEGVGVNIEELVWLKLGERIDVDADGVQHRVALGNKEHYYIMFDGYSKFKIRMSKELEPDLYQKLTTLANFNDDSFVIS